MKRKVLAGFICLLFLWSGAMGCSPSQVEGESGVQKPVVMVAQAQTGEIQETVVLSGQVTPRVHINVIPEIAGKVETVEVQEGDSVKKGQLLAQLDAESQKLQLDQARTALRLANAQLEHSRESYALQEQNRELTSRSDQGNKDYHEQNKQIEDLYIEGKITEEERKSFQSFTTQSQEEGQFTQPGVGGISPQQIKMMEIQVEQAQIQVKLAELLYNKMNIKAPMEGTVAMVNLKAGEIASPAMPAFVLADMDTVYVQAALPEGAVNRVTPGLNVLVYVPAVQAEAFKGEVEEVNILSPDGGRAYPFKIVLDNSQGLLKGGMYARLEVPVEQREETILIPLEALVMEEGADSVFVLENNKALKKQVLLGLRDEKHVEILEGLNSGDRVIVRGQSSLLSGMEVEVLEEGE